MTSRLWTACSPETVPGFSAVAYFFGRKLHRDLEIPIGLIHSSWGGTVAEAWMRKGALEENADFASLVQGFEKTVATTDAAKAQKKIYAEGMDAWRKALDEMDAGMKDGKAIWAVGDYDDSDWKSMPRKSRASNSTVRTPPIHSANDSVP